MIYNIYPHTPKEKYISQEWMSQQLEALQAITKLILLLLLLLLLLILLLLIYCYELSSPKNTNNSEEILERSCRRNDDK